MVHLSHRVLAFGLMIPLGLTACRDRAERELVKQTGDVRIRPRDTTRTLGRGDVQITNADRSIELALIGDSVVTGFGDKVLNEIQRATDTAAVTGNGFGASIAKMVKQTVAGALSRQLYFPIRNISDVRYENGNLQFYNPDGSKMHLFENTKVDGKQATMTFERADAERFIAAFRARKAATSG